MTRAAVRLLLIEPHAFGEIRRVEGLRRLRAAGFRERDRNNREDAKENQMRCS